MRVDVLAQLDKSLICRGPGAEPVAVEESTGVFNGLPGEVDRPMGSEDYCETIREETKLK